MLLLALACYLFLPAGMRAQQGGVARYLYDDNGRLKAVLLSNGEASIYHYDAAGNLVSVTQQSSNVLFIIDFTPKMAGIGGTVTIYGTGFSANASENAVAFNGQAASIISSTNTEIVTSVPVGATTGFINVTSPLGTVNSTMPFSVLSPPTITGFNPLAGSVGSAVTITGTNFEVPPGQTEVRFNGVIATTSSVTPTSLTANVPNCSSGHISVTTSAGTVVSSEDFFVSPTDNINVTVTGRLAYGEPKSFTLPGAGQAALFLFDGMAGQRVSLNLFNASYRLNADVSIYSPDGLELVSPTGTEYDYHGVFIDTVTLPATGTYSVLIDTSNYVNSYGSGTVQLFNVPPDATGAIEFDSQATIANTVPGQNARLLFTGTAGERVRMTGNINQPLRSGYLSVLAPDGSPLSSPQFMAQTLYGQQTATITNLTLPADGTYTILVDPSRADITSATVALSGPPSDLQLTLTAGSPRLFVQTEIGQNARLTFSGTAGQRVSLDFSEANYTINSQVSITGPNNEQLLPLTWFDYTYRGIFVEPLTLPADGTYTVLIDTLYYAYANNHGSVYVQLYDVPPDVTGTIELGGQALLTTTVPGQNGRVFFTGTAGQKVNITGRITQGGGAGYLSVYAPDGTRIGSPDFMYPGSVFGTDIAYFDRLTLPVDGTYSIFVDPFQQYTNGTTVTLTEPPEDLVETITPGGPPVTVTTTIGQNARLTFSGSAGQHISLALTDVSINGSVVSIIHPQGWTMESEFIYGGNIHFFDTMTLPADGAYTIYVDPYSSDTGQMTLTLYDVPPDATGSLTVGGAPATLTLTTPGQNGQMTFEGATGQHVSLNLTDVSISNSNVSVINPDGSMLVWGTYVSFGGLLIRNLDLPADGTYRIIVDPYGMPTGSMTMTAYESNPPEITGAITTDGAHLDLTFERPEQKARITFEANAGQTLNLVLSNVTVTRSAVQLYQPDGSLIFGPTWVDTNGDTLTFENLPVNGTYTILIAPDLAYTGGMRLSLSPVLDFTGSVEVGGAAVTVTTGPAQNARLALNGEAGHRLVLRFTGSTIYESYVSILNPDGTTLVEGCRITNSDANLDIQTLPATGAYTILINPTPNTPGEMTIQATDTGELALAGPEVTVVLPATQPEGALSFNGTAGRRINIFTWDVTIPNGTLSVYRPDGTLLRTANLNGIFNLTLPEDGTYTLRITPEAGSGGGRITLFMNRSGGGSGGDNTL